MWGRLPYRLQIPLGLSLAVLLTAALVTFVAATFSARVARADSLARVARAATLLEAQGLPLLSNDDIFRAFTLLRDTVGLLPGSGEGHARAALLDAAGRVFASSSPARLGIGAAILGVQTGSMAGATLHLPVTVPERTTFSDLDGSVRLVDPIRSDDGKLLGYSYIEVDAPVFMPDWVALMQPALLGALLAVVLLAPIGWAIGRRMTRPVADIARAIEELGRGDAAVMRRRPPASGDTELARIADAVVRLTEETAVRQRAERRALSAERMAAVGRLTGAIAHEINNPLGGLLNAVQTLRLRGGDERVRERTLGLLGRGLQQIQATVAALLPQARVEDRALVPADLDDMLLLARSAAAASAVEVSASVEADAVLRVASAPMRQVMLNLLLNAIKAAGEGGRVQAQLVVDADRVRFCVSNTGARLTQQALDRILDAEGDSDPRGFGLWVCRELALLHGGGFELDAADRDGTRLTFWMPNGTRDA